MTRFWFIHKNEFMFKNYVLIVKMIQIQGFFSQKVLVSLWRQYSLVFMLCNFTFSFFERTFVVVKWKSERTSFIFNSKRWRLDDSGQQSWHKQMFIQYVTTGTNFILYHNNYKKRKIKDIWSSWERNETLYCCYWKTINSFITSLACSECFPLAPRHARNFYWNSIRFSVNVD